ncbi:hypothetical protein [Stygiolobus caldivivus]|uniref:Uncharacterized protein n=1 Tax=Stygiolobus caldivivus TaxID=2824673 RepID=A0A8D5U7N8_9CREN|nr:hypothetical protein [Stygiolobus caldivivus]BCU70864.1 hypothetical protein KN1_21610 [Stygiolobus caldivivus]
MINSRELGWNVLTGIGFSFVITIVMAILAGIVKLFYPPTDISISPIISIFQSPALGIIQIIMLAGIIAFVTPVRSKVIREELGGIRRLGIYVGVGYLIFSILPYAFHVPYPQTYIGLIIAFNVINGFVGGYASTILS